METHNTGAWCQSERAVHHWIASLTKISPMSFDQVLVCWGSLVCFLRAFCPQEMLTIKLSNLLGEWEDLISEWGGVTMTCEIISPLPANMAEQELKPSWPHVGEIAGFWTGRWDWGFGLRSGGNGLVCWESRNWWLDDSAAFGQNSHSLPAQIKKLLNNSWGLSSAVTMVMVQSEVQRVLAALESVMMRESLIALIASE